MQNNDMLARQSQEGVLSTHKVLRNTYFLLSMTLLFSAITAGIAVMTKAPYLGVLPTLAGVYGLMFLTQSLRNSAWGLLSCFAFTGFMGYTLGPLMNAIISNFSNGSEIIMTALGATGVIFFALSGYVTMTRKDFSYLGGFLFIGIMFALLAMIAGFFFAIPALHLAISAAFVLISSGMILFETSQIIHGGERNYIMATITLYVSLYNLFVSLVQIFAALAGNRD